MTLEVSKTRKLRHAHCLYFRNELRNARAEVLRDSENFSEIVFVLERLGSFLDSDNEGLGQYKDDLKDLASESPLLSLYGNAWGSSFDSLFLLLKEARNDSMHAGALARHAANNSVLISLILEDALMSNSQTLSEFMVIEPVCAEMWQPIGLIRQKMLANSFSFLPVKTDASDSKWALISDSALASFLRGISRTQRKKRLASDLLTSVTSGHIELESATCCLAGTQVSDVKGSIGQKPILIFQDGDRERLIGIVTAFDLL